VVGKDYDRIFSLWAGLVFGLALIIGGLLLGGSLWLFSRTFFWIVDIVPSKGSDDEEARAVVLYGEHPLLLKKLDSKIEDWTEKDTEKLASYTLRRCRLFFGTSAKSAFARVFGFCSNIMKRPARG